MITSFFFPQNDHPPHRFLGNKSHGNPIIIFSNQSHRSFLEKEKTLQSNQEKSNKSPIESNSRSCKHTISITSYFPSCLIINSLPTSYLNLNPTLLEFPSFPSAEKTRRKPFYTWQRVCQCSSWLRVLGPNPSVRLLAYAPSAEFCHVCRVLPVGGSAASTICHALLSAESRTRLTSPLP